MSQITYILGAGASAETLPTVAQLPNRLEQFIDDLEVKYMLVSGVKRRNDPEAIRYDDFIKALKWLCKVAKSSETIDTYARKLYISKEYSELQKLKSAINAYFSIAQGISTVDKRYEGFISRILIQNDNGEYVFPETVRILNWNYDNQFEKAYFGFCKNKEKVIKDITFNDKHFYHLNGYCGTTTPGHIGQSFYAIINGSIKDVIKGGIALYHEGMNSSNSIDIRYAWEEETKVYFRNSISNMELQKTDTLVVIDYSFPQINKNIDKDIFQELNKLNNVVIQVPKEAYQDIANKIIELGFSGTITHNQNTNSFYMPY